MNKENLIQYFLRGESLLVELDDLVIKWDDHSPNAEEKSSFSELVRIRLSRTDAPLLGYRELLDRLDQNNVDISGLVHAFEVRFGSEVSFASLDKFLADCMELKLQGDLIKVSESIARALYERMILSDFLKVPCSIKMIGSREQVVDSVSTQQVFERMKATAGSSNLNRFERTSNVFSEQFLKNVAMVIDGDDNSTSKKGGSTGEIATVLEEFIKIASGLRNDILRNVFRSAQMVKLEDTISIYENLAVKQGFGTSVISEYAKFICTTLSCNPGKLMSDRLTKLSENIKQAFLLASLEESVLREHRISKEWMIAPSLVQIEKFTELVRMVQDPQAESLLAEYYSKPLAFEFDISKSRFWSAAAALHGAGAGQLLLGDYFWAIDMDRDSALLFYRTVFDEQQLIEAGYKAACILLDSRSLLYEELAGLSILTRIKESGYAPSVFVLGLNSKYRWLRRKQQTDLDVALKFMSEAARHNYGAAKFELDLFALSGWMPDSINESELPKIKEAAQSADPVAAYKYLTQGRLLMRDSLRLSPQEIQESCLQVVHKTFSDNIVLDFLKAELQLARTGETDRGMELMERTARSGHPEACLRLSKIYEKSGQMDKAILWQEGFISNAGFFGPHMLECHPLRRLYELKNKYYSHQ